MKLIIYNKKKYLKNFISDYLPLLISKSFDKLCDKKRLALFDKEFNIDSLDIINEALDNLRVSEQQTSYILEIDKNKKYKGKSIDSYINLITYGNRDCKGYKIIYFIFNSIAKNIDELYEGWLETYGN